MDPPLYAGMCGFARIRQNRAGPAASAHPDYRASPLNRVHPRSDSGSADGYSLPASAGGMPPCFQPPLLAFSAARPSFSCRRCPAALLAFAAALAAVLARLRGAVPWPPAFRSAGRRLVLVGQEQARIEDDLVALLANPTVTSTILSLLMPRVISRSTGPSGVMTKHFRVLAHVRAEPTTACSGMVRTWFALASVVMVTSALMSGRRPSIGSSMETIVWYTFTSADRKSCCEATVATVLTCRLGSCRERNPCGCAPVARLRISRCSTASSSRRSWTGPGRTAPRRTADSRSRGRPQGGLDRVAETGLLPLVAADPRDHGLVDRVLTTILVRSGMRMSFWPSRHRLALGDDGLLRALAAAASLPARSRPPARRAGHTVMHLRISSSISL